MAQFGKGWIGLRRSAPDADWHFPRPPFGPRGGDGPGPRSDVRQRVSTESSHIRSQLALEPAELALTWGKLSVSWNAIVLSLSWLVIGLVAAYDTYLSVKFQDSLPFLEMNPLCRMLIAADEGSVAMLLGFKFAGTIISLGAILLVYQFRRSIGTAIAAIVACLQGTLFLYLAFA